MKAILDYRPTKLGRIAGIAAASLLALEILPQPDPKTDPEFDATLRALGVPPELIAEDIPKYGPFERRARYILGVMAPAGLCFVLLSPEVKRAVLNPRNWSCFLTDLAPRAAKGYVSMLLPQLAVTAFNHYLLPYVLGPDRHKVTWSRGILVTALCLRYWRPGSQALVWGLPSSVLGLRGLGGGFSRQNNPRYWMFFDIAACGPFTKLSWCVLFGPWSDLPRYTFEGLQAFVTAAAATRLERALIG